MGDPVSIHAGLDEIHPGARTEVRETIVIRAHQIAGGSTDRMHIGSGTENRHAHRPHLEYTRARHRSIIVLTRPALQESSAPR